MSESIRHQLARASARARSLPSWARPTWTRPFGEPKPLCGQCDDRWIDTPDGYEHCPRCHPAEVAS